MKMKVRIPKLLKQNNRKKVCFAGIMNTEQIREIEINLGLSLPDFYLEAQRNLPQKVITECSEYAFFVNPKYVINEILSQRTTFYSEKEEWTDGYVVIGISGFGDYYFIDVKEEESPVYCYNHEKDKFEIAASSVQHWITRLDKNSRGTK